MKYVIENVDPRVHEFWGNRSLKHPNYPSDLHLDAQEVSKKELKAFLKSIGRSRYIKMVPGKRGKRWVIHNQKTLAAGLAGAAGAAYLLTHLAQ